MKLTFLTRFATRRRGLALIIVVTSIALISVLMVAIFSVTRTEFKSTQAFVAGRTAKQLGEMSTALVQAQLQNAQNITTSASRTTHATQPGMARVYSADGNFSAAYKLYSSGQMKVEGEESSLYGPLHIPPSDWHTKPARFVDLNEPVVRPGLSAAAGSYAVYFPVLDPRAAYNYRSGGQTAGADGTAGTTQVEGFSYTEKTPSVGTASTMDYSARVVTLQEAGSKPDNMRLPMPVEWLYVLEDGTIGVLDNTNKFVSSGGASKPSKENPIVGRIAFWADDESCKININTASEPTFTSTPFFFHERDSRWAHFPPVTGEYQRYPGHPATVALSSVLAPNYRLDPLLPAVDKLSTEMDVVKIKEAIYLLAPKISGGGSEAGTRPFVQDDLSPENNERQAANSISLATGAKERLYASVDEMLFSAEEMLAGKSFNKSKGRVRAQVEFPNGDTFFDHETLERSRFFLTASSRSPEFTIHGAPRVCMWPVADESKDYKFWRTSFDNIIALCATMGKPTGSTSTARSYFFRRANARNSTSDVVNITRNSQLLTYLADQMSDLNWPATSYSSSGGNANFNAKYGQDNVNQLAIQFFDYIRCTNLYDGILARKNNAWNSRDKYNSTPAVEGGATTGRYFLRDDLQGDSYTFTAQRISRPPTTIDNVSVEQGSGNERTGSQGVLPSHGQVSPAIWEKGGQQYKGFGRSITLSEIGFQFICTADGSTEGDKNTNYGGILDTFPDAADYGKGGGTALRTNQGYDEGNNPTANSAYQGLNVGGGQAYWWSNFPPLITPADVDAAIAYYGCKTGTNDPPELHPSKHPGFDPSLWNMTLAQGTPLKTNEKRVQVMLMLETFCPSLGWTSIYPEFTIVLDGDTIAQMTLNNKKLFDTTGDIPIKSYGNIYGNSSGVHAVGGHAGPSAIAGGRRTRNISNGGGVVLMPTDPNYDTNNSQGHQALQNFPFISDFITVDRTTDMEVSFPGEPIKIRIYDTHNWENAEPIQTLMVDFSGVPGTVPVPYLVQTRPYTETIDPQGRPTYTRSRQGPHYWCGNFSGCLGRMKGQFAGDGVGWTEPPTYVQQVQSGDNAPGGQLVQVLRGRLDTSNTVFGDSRPGIRANGVSIIAEGSSDVIRTLVPTVGDYRLLAAMKEVPASWWQPHPLWSSGLEDLRQAHSFTGYWANSEPGAKLAQDISSGAGTNYQNDPSLQLVGGARYNLKSDGSQLNTLSARQADLPPSKDYASAANAFGDFDSGLSNAREGPYINKPDEGNYYAGNELRGNVTKYFRSSYFYESEQNAEDWRSGIYMTPNRLISSPVMFGSLPTGVWGNPGGLPNALENTSMGSQDYAPWQTLLFRPHASITTEDPNSNTSHPGMENPSDHYLLDLFFMPVVEPYAISEPLSVAGRVNMNYQIMPFTHIRRATGLHAVMKGEYITAIPNEHVTASKEYMPNQAVWKDRFWDDDKEKRYWHRPIDVPATLRQFDLKFTHLSGGQTNYQGLFRSASQICEMHLIPTTKTGAGIQNVSGALGASNQKQINDMMDNFWADNRATGDNVRERSYSNLYARLTTRSNTFRVHVRSQAIKKARSVAPDVFDAAKDAVVSEYRGSTLLERYIDPNDSSSIPDYAVAGVIGQYPLDAYYRFRVLETKRFSP